MAQRYKDDFIEVLKEGNSIVIKDLATKRIVQAPLSAGHELDFQQTKPVVKRSFFVAYLAFSTAVILLSITLGAQGARNVDPSQLSWASILLLLGYSSCQIIMHELAHYLVFRAMGRVPDKVGFKLNYYVFPAFYVRMNDTHLLTRQDRYVVHTAGIVVNGTITLAAFSLLHFESLGHDWLFVFSWYAIAMAYNCIPILNSDGFKALLALVGHREAKHFKHNSMLIKTIIVISYIVAALYTIRIIFIGIFALGE